jgi:hypothetical protein
MRAEAAYYIGAISIQAEQRGISRAAIAMKQNDEEAFTDEVTDDALEAAGAAKAGGAVTLIQGSYCFTCGQEQWWKPDCQS